MLRFRSSSSSWGRMPFAGLDQQAEPADARDGRFLVKLSQGIVVALDGAGEDTPTLSIGQRRADDGIPNVWRDVLILVHRHAVEEQTPQLLGILGPSSMMIEPGAFRFFGFGSVTVRFISLIL